jgi:hypothetical protein
MKPPGPKGCRLIVCSSLANSSGLNSITIRRGVESASFRERSIGSWAKPWFSAKARVQLEDLALRPRAELRTSNPMRQNWNSPKTDVVTTGNTGSYL